jgi:hypothetical protein
MADEQRDDGLDVAGFGKIAKAIPPKVYERTSAALLTTFQQVIAPITESTSGLGRYIRQKFDNMVEAEKAIATYTLEKAVARAKVEAARSGKALHGPSHPKTFVKTVEEASKETDPLIHEMWTNLLASQLTDDVTHPHFVEVLSHFSSAEARLLISLLLRPEIGENDGEYLGVDYDWVTYWIPRHGAEQRPWTISCRILCEFNFAKIVGPKGGKPDGTAILFRTVLGAAFLSAVSPRGSKHAV